MKELMMNEDFSDVTLVTEDKKQIKANIHILSACSPVFKDILKKEKNSSPIMYLRGIQYSELESIMQFIYLGEATFNEERMDEFLAVAKSLEIEELCNVETESNNVPEEHPSTNYQEQTVKSDNYQATTQGDITSLIPSKHEGFNFNTACNQCDYQTTNKKHLTVHIQSKHEGIRYACDHCDYQATQKSSLTVHIKSKHEGVRYPCTQWQCDYQATRQNYLTRHIESKHNGVKVSNSSH